MSPIPRDLVHPSSIRARLSGSVVAFLLGFAVANVGLIAVPRPDMWLWLGVGVVMMLTGVAGVLFADTARNLSVWAVLGVQLFLAFTVTPLLWLLSQATTQPGQIRSSLWPQSWDWSAFGQVWEPGIVRDAIVTSVLVGTVSTVIAMAVAIPAAYGLVQRPPRGVRWWYAAFLVALVVPTFAFAAPAAAQLLDLGLATSRLAYAVPTLVVALPLAIWLTVRAFRRAPWGLSAAIRADGADRRQWWRHFALRHLALDVGLITLIVFFWTTSDLALGLGLAPTERQRSLSATLLDLGSDPESSPLVAAVGLWWLVPLVIVVAVFSRRLVSLLGRTA